MEHHISIAQFINAIRRLPEDKSQVTPGKWYLTQKEHWLGWLGEYEGPGAYGRKTFNRDAKFAYNHIVCPDMLVSPSARNWSKGSMKHLRSKEV